MSFWNKLFGGRTRPKAEPPVTLHQSVPRFTMPDLDALNSLFGITALLKAAEAGDADAVNRLVARAVDGADLNARDDNGTTELERAALNLRARSVKALIDAGADVHLRDRLGATTLYYAVLAPSIGEESENRVECVKLLIGAGVDVNASDNLGRTPLMYASDNNLPRCVSALINAGADLNAKSDQGETALSCARNRPSVLSILQANAKDREGKTSRAEVLSEVICVSGPHKSKIILVFGDGHTETAGVHTKQTFGYDGDGSARFSSYLKEKEFAFRDASQFKAPHRYCSDGSHMAGELIGNEILWEDGTTIRVPSFPY
jgi:hypothetical protein